MTSAGGHEPVVATVRGRVRGTLEGEVAVFRGIPYAAAPVGPLRFSPPRPAPPWRGVCDATRFSPAALQPPPAPPFDALFATPQRTSEDCLTLNVWTPAPGAAALPVLVWLHSGGFLTGSGSDAMYEASAFARHGVVTVTLNHRLGVLGFLYLDELFPGACGTGNLGLLDQLAALQWVQANIEAFGGDPLQVTLGGVSAGGMSVASHLAADAGAELFARAIAQSGAGRNARSTDAATRVARRVLSRIGIPPGDWDALLAAPAGKLVDAAAHELASSAHAEDRSGPLGLAFEPVIDGLLLTALPEAVALAGASRPAELLIGWTRDEWRLFSSLEVDGPLDEDTSNTRDAFAEPAMRFGQAHVVRARTWMYRFDWPSPSFGGRLGACHGLDVPFVFDTLHGDFARRLGCRSAPPSLAAAMHAAWVAFIGGQAPGAPGLPRWPTVPSIMRLDTVCDLIDER